MKFKNLSKTKKFDDLLNIDGIGETQINSIKVFLNEINLKVLNELEKVLTINNSVLENKMVCKNKAFLVTGKLDGISRLRLSL